MRCNFIGRSHQGIVEAGQAWEAASDRFGEADGCPGDRLPAPHSRTPPSHRARTPRVTDYPELLRKAA
ncbi:hypothetical protein SALBM135S_01893 [Streptomyces alboniger]